MDNNTNTITTPVATTHAYANLLETRLSSNPRVTLTDLAVECNDSVQRVRRVLTEVYGTRIQFKRGRKGGITLS